MSFSSAPIRLIFSASNGVAFESVGCSPSFYAEKSAFGAWYIRFADIDRTIMRQWNIGAGTKASHIYSTVTACRHEMGACEICPSKKNELETVAFLKDIVHAEVDADRCYAVVKLFTAGQSRILANRTKIEADAYVAKAIAIEERASADESAAALEMSIKCARISEQEGAEFMARMARLYFDIAGKDAHIASPLRGMLAVSDVAAAKVAPVVPDAPAVPKVTTDVAANIDTIIELLRKITSQAEELHI